MTHNRFSSTARLASWLILGGSVSALGVFTACSSSDTTGTGGATASTTGSLTTSSTPTSTGAQPTTGATMSTTTASTGTGGPPAGFDCTAATGTIPALKLTSLTTDASEAVLVKSAPDDPDRLYVVEKNGKIAIIENGQLLPTPFLDISSLLIDSDEEGLLGLAFHPQYKTNGRFFVHYSKKGNGDNVVQEFKRSDTDPHIANPTPVLIALEHPTAQPNHNGGALEFGPDGFLYVTMGDGGNQGDPECDAQLDVAGDPTVIGNTNLFGKISRLDVDGTPDATGYPAAAGNPNGLKSYHRGFRNPWRIGFDQCTGDLFVGDVGQDTYEEVDQIKTTDGPVNGGWPYREGTHPYSYNMNTCPTEPALTTFHEPILDYTHAASGNAVIGGYMYRSSTIPALRGAYFYGDNGSGKIWYVFPGSPTVLTSLTPGAGVLGGWGQDGHGNIFAASLDGNIYRVDAM